MTIFKHHIHIVLRSFLVFLFVMCLRQQIALDEQNAKRILCRSSLSFSFTHTDTENTKTQTLTYKKKNKLLIVSSIFLYLSLFLALSLSPFRLFEARTKNFLKKTHTHTRLHTHTHWTPNTLLLIFLNAGTRHQITIYHALSLSLFLVLYFYLALSRSLFNSPTKRNTKKRLKVCNALAK